MDLSNFRSSALCRFVMAFSMVISVSVAAIVMPDPAMAIGVKLTPIGGSATGAVGDTLSIGIDLVIEEGEFVTLADPTLQWDLEGGNVLDAKHAESLQIAPGGIPFNPILLDRWRLFDPTLIDEDGRGDFGDLVDKTLDLNDDRLGASAVWGFELASHFYSSEEQLLEVYSSGVSEAGTHRIGVIDFLLREVGSTTISFVTDERFGFRSYFAGSQFETLPNNTIELSSLNVSGSDFAALQIFVVPEPGTAILLGFGLSMFSSLGRRSRR